MVRIPLAGRIPSRAHSLRSGLPKCPNEQHGGKNGGGGATLRRFDILATRDAAQYSGPQVPIPYAKVDFYRQGAAFSSGSVTIANGSTGSINVFSVGGLLPGDSVRAGLGGPILTVSSIDPSTDHVTLSNSTGYSVTILAGTRFIDLTNRPTAYQDALGTTSIGSQVIADSGGRAVVYLPDGAYDYVVSGNDAVTIDSVQSGSVDDATDTLSWAHSATGASRAVLVAIAWQELSGAETLDLVTFGGLPMTLIGNFGLLSLFYLVNPPTGSKTVAAKWSGTAQKAAVGSSVSMINALQTLQTATVRAANGSGTTASVTAKGTTLNGLAIGALAVDSTPSTGITVTLGSGPTEIWNITAGTVGHGDRTVGAGAEKASNAGDIAFSWSWASGQTRSWDAMEVEILPDGLRLYTDQYGERCCESNFGLNVLDFPGIQETIDALPATGGVVYISAGTYRLRAGLTITKPNVTLIGEGATTVIEPDDPDSLPVDLLTISAAEARLHRIKFDGLASEADLVTGKCGIVFNGYDGPYAPERLVQHCFLENVIVTGCSKFGLWLRDTILLTAINCEAGLNPGTGLRIQGTDPHGVSTTLRFIGCAFSNNGGLGVDIGDVLFPPDTGGTGQASQTFLGCTMELNQGEGYTLADVGLSLNAEIGIKIEVLSCYFEAPAEGAHQFVRFHNCPNATVDNCIFFGNTGSPSSGPDQAVSFVNCPYARATSNVMQGFKTAIVTFDDGCNDSVEMCNRDLDTELTTGVPRITIGSAVVTGMSQRSLALPTYTNDASRPNAAHLRSGSMIWVVTPTTPNTQLQVSNGTVWTSF